MANGPAGKIVGRINIRVAPDTSKFREELRAQLGSINEEIKVKVQLDLADARAQLAALGQGASIDVQVRVDAAQARAEIANLDGGTVRVRVVVDDPNVRTVDLDARISIDMAHWRAQVARINPVRLDARVDVDQTRISNQVRTAINRGIATANDVDVGADGAFGRGGSGGSGGRRGGIFSIFTNIPSNLVGILTGSFQALQGIATLNFSQFIGGLQSAVSSILSLVAAVALSGAIASLLIVAGAAISAAWGIVATTISAIPGVLAAVAIPLGVIALGIDGITKAAQTLAPEFNHLKAVVSAEFEGSFTRAFNTIRPLFGLLEKDVLKVATAIGYFVNVFAMFAVAETTVRNLQKTFDNVSQTILSLTQPLGKIVETTLQITALEESFYPLLAVVTTFGREFQASVGDLISDGRLQQALRGLGDVLSEVTRGFVALVENGIRLFAAAAPGIEVFFKSLTDFFNKFDYNRLGKAVGDVFEGIGKALDKVKPGTIEAITQAFEGIGKKFQDPNLQKVFANLLDGIPALITGFGLLIDWFGRIASAALGFAMVVKGVGESIVRLLQAPGQIPDLISGKLPFEDFLKQMGSGADDIRNGLGLIKDAFRTGIAEIDTTSLTGFTKIGATVLNAGITVANNATAAGQQILASLSKNKADIDTALKPGDKDYEAPWKTAVFGVETGIKTAMDAAVATAKSLVTGLGTATQPGPEAQQTPSLWERILSSVTSLIGVKGSEQLVAATSARTGTETALKPTGGLSETWNGFLSGVQTAITTATTGWATAASTGAAATSTATSTGLAGVPAAASSALAPLGSIISNAFAAVQVSVALVALQVQVAAAMLAIQFTVTTGVAGIQLALSTGFANIGSVVAIAFTLMQVTALTGMLGISTAVVSGFATILAAFQTGTVQMQSLFTIAMTLIQVSAITGMLAVTLAITSGMAQSVAAVQNGVNQMVAALQAGVGQFTAAGAQMGQGLVNGLLSKLGAVQAAAAQLANAAAAAVAAAAQINSPSRVTTRLGEFFGQGFVRGMDRSRKWIAKSAKGWVDVVTGFVEKVNEPIGKTSISGSVVGTQFATIDHSMRASVNDPGFGERVAQALEGWTVQIDHNGLAKMVNKSNNERKRR